MYNSQPDEVYVSEIMYFVEYYYEV